jgi:LEA14-like dessication related protein
MAEHAGTRGARRAMLAAACALPLLASCAVLPRFETPKLSIVALKVQSADLFSQRVQIRLRVMNPNTRELPVKGISYRIELNGTELGNGATNTEFVVPAMGEAEFDAMLTTNLAAALGKLLSRRGQESLDYRLVGDVALASGFLRRIPFDEKGSVRL